MFQRPPAINGLYGLSSKNVLNASTSEVLEENMLLHLPRTTITPTKIARF